MTRNELIAAVPIHWHNGRPFFVRLDDVPEPYREQLFKTLVGCACPALPGEDRQLYYAWDWESWVHGQWYGRGPIGLDN